MCISGLGNGKFALHFNGIKKSLLINWCDRGQTLRTTTLLDPNSLAMSTNQQNCHIKISGLLAKI